MDKSSGDVIAKCYNGYITISSQEDARTVEVVLHVEEDATFSGVTLSPVLNVGMEESDLVKFWK